MKEKILYVGIFDADAIVNFCSGFPSSNGFIGGLESSERKGEENKYVFKGLRKVNPYVRLNMNITIYWQMKNLVDVKVGDQTTTMVRGKIRCVIDVNKETDYKGEFAADKKSQAKKKSYEKSIEGELDDMDDRLVGIYLDWVSGIKKILKTML